MCKQGFCRRSRRFSSSLWVRKFLEEALKHLTTLTPHLRVETIPTVHFLGADGPRGFTPNLTPTYPRHPLEFTWQQATAIISSSLHTLTPILTGFRAHIISWGFEFGHTSRNSSPRPYTIFPFDLLSPFELNTDDDGLWVIVRGLPDTFAVITSISVSGSNGERWARVAGRFSG